MGRRKRPPLSAARMLKGRIAWCMAREHVVDKKWREIKTQAERKQASSS